MYRFVSILAKEIRTRRTDPDNHGFYGDDWYYVETVTIKKMYKPWSRYRDYTVDKTAASAVKNKYISEHNGQLIMEEPGEDLISGYGYGLVKEVIYKEWKIFGIFFTIVGFVLGYIVNRP